MNKVNISYQGIPGSYSLQALDYYFRSYSYRSISNNDFESVFYNITNRNCKYGIVPIENTLGGSVICNYDFLYHG